MLASSELVRAITEGRWRAYRDGEPIAAEDLKLGPHSCDCGLQDTLLRVRPAGKHAAIDPYDPATMYTEEIKIGPRGFILMPGDFVLGATRERFECDAALQIWETREDGVESVWRNFHMAYEGRSTLARLGLSSHQSAAYIDFGFAGTVTLELSTLVPLRLYAGMRIGQVSWQPLFGEVTTGYSGAYVNQLDGPRAAELGRDRF